MPHLIDPLAEHVHVAVLGYGASGRAAVRLLRHFNKRVCVADWQMVDVPVIDGVTFHPGSHDIGEATAVVLSPSFNPDWPENRAKPSLASLYARIESGEVFALSEVELGLRAFARPYIAVGGTDGKSTTAAIAHAIAPAFGRRAVLGGNSWRAFSEIALEAAPETDSAVVEISAFQLHRPHGIHPRVGIMTNLAFDHLDHYAGFEDYAGAKFSMFMHQEAGDFAVLCGGQPRIEALGERLARAGVSVGYFGNDEGGLKAAAPLMGAGEDNGVLVMRARGHTVRLRPEDIAVQGAHNRRNVMAAVLAWMNYTGRAPDRTVLHRALADFEGLAHRMATVRVLEDVLYLDDSKATNVHAACVGIRSVERPIVAIVGGVDKGLALDELWAALEERGRLVVAIGQLQARLVDEAPSALPVRCAASLQEAVRMAHSEARPGDAVLLSPASSSFDMFSGFGARGDAFIEAVQRLSH